MDNKLIKTETVLGRVLNVYGTPEDPLFMARDVADWIEHTNSREMVRILDDNEKLVSTILTSGQHREVQMITEDGLYEVLMLSRKPIAKSFKKEVKRMLHELRIYGITATPATLEEMIKDPKFAIRLFTELEAEREAKKKEKLRADLNEQKVCLANHTIREQAPKIEYHDKVLSSNNDFTSTSIAKELQFKSAQAMHKDLYRKQIMFKRDDHWVLYSKYAGQLYTMTRTHIYQDAHDNTRTVRITTWTEKGRRFLHGIYSDRWDLFNSNIVSHTSNN